MYLRIHHHTRYRYDSPVSFGDHALFLRPLDGTGRKILSFDLTTTPESTRRWVTDAEGNVIRVCGFGLQTSDVLEFDLRMEIDLEDQNPFDFILAADATGVPLVYSESDRRALQPFLGDGDGPTADWFRQAGVAPDRHDDVVGYLAGLNSHIHDAIRYVRRDEEGIQPPDETIRLASGSCRDMAMLFMQGARELGFAARFVSGYLYDPPDQDGHMFNRAVGSMHAWAEIYLPGAGWKGFDPTNGILANGNFVPSAVSYDPRRVDPVQGAYFSPQSSPSFLEVTLTLEEVFHDPA